LPFDAGIAKLRCLRSADHNHHTRQVVGVFGGFAGPYFMGWMKAATGTYSLALVIIGAGLAASGVIALALRRVVAGEHLPASAVFD
jgi:dipeptide/tripeptide permease